MLTVVRLYISLLSLTPCPAPVELVDNSNAHYRHKEPDTTEAEKVAQVRVTVHSIDRSLSSYQKVVKEDVPGESLEGNEIIQYLMDHQIRKIAAVFYGETGKKSEEFYFDDEHLIFYYVKEERYNVPLGSGDVKVASAIEKRYYFFNGELFLVKLKPESQSMVDMKKLSEEISKEAQRLMKLK
jgi:regulator of sirC expression with transglutaminase-like and TPR domain